MRRLDDEGHVSATAAKSLPSRNRSAHQPGDKQNFVHVYKIYTSTCPPTPNIQNLGRSKYGPLSAYEEKSRKLAGRLYLRRNFFKGRHLFQTTKDV